MYVTTIYTPSGSPVSDLSEGQNGGPPVDLKPENIEGGPTISAIAGNFGATIFDGPFAESKKGAKDMLDAMTSYKLTSPPTAAVTSNTITLTQCEVESPDERLSNTIDCLAAIVETLTKRGYEPDSALDCALLITKNG